MTSAEFAEFFTEIGGAPGPVHVSAPHWSDLLMEVYSCVRYQSPAELAALNEAKSLVWKYPIRMEFVPDFALPDGAFEIEQPSAFQMEAP